MPLELPTQRTFQRQERTRVVKRAHGKRLELLVRRRVAVEELPVPDDLVPKERIRSVERLYVEFSCVRSLEGCSQIGREADLRPEINRRSCDDGNIYVAVRMRATVNRRAVENHESEVVLSRDAGESLGVERHLHAVQYSAARAGTRERLCALAVSLSKWYRYRVALFSPPPSNKELPMSASSGKIVSGVFCLLGGFASAMLGLFVGLWAHAHSPHTGFGELLVKVSNDPHAYILNEPFYTIVCLFAGGLGLVGFVLLVLGVVLCATAGTRPRSAPPLVPHAPWKK